jgi:S-adenosylmethionine:tRNA ribosyltransferase-isomerase
VAAAGVIADLTVPPHLEAAEPPEARGLKRDQVRLLVSHVAADTLEHARFDDLPRWLSAGDVLVVNTSGTLNAALPATGEAGESLELHLSTALPGGFWSVELRGRIRTRAGAPCCVCRAAQPRRCSRHTRWAARSMAHHAYGWRR